MQYFVKSQLITIAVLLTACSFSASAQEWVGVNRDDYGNVVRGTYLTNEWFDNWYIGVRFGYQGFTGKEYLTTWYNPWQINHAPLPFDSPLGGQGTLSYGMAYFHGDVLWNISNGFGKYSTDASSNMMVNWRSTGRPVRLVELQ